MATLIDAEAFVTAAKWELAELEKDYSETERSWRGAQGSEADRRMQQLKGVREGIAEARKAMNRALQGLLPPA